MASKEKVTCPSCGFANTLPLAKNRCVSCGAKVDDLKRSSARPSSSGRRYEQEGFSVSWFFISLVIMGVLTAALVIGMPMVVPLLDFEGQAGMTIAIPVWFVGGVLIGLISPGRTFIEPVVAAFFVAIPTALFLFAGQTVKTMPSWMYVLMSVLGILFTLIGAYLGERVQIGMPAKASD